MSLYETDVAIIGAGPVGLFSIFECGMMKLKCHVIDALPEAGGQCIALYPEKPIFDIPAHPKILAADLIHNLMEQARPFNPHFHLNQKVEALEKVDEHWQLTTSLGTVIKAKAIIIAAGVGAFGPNRPPLENLEAFEPTSVFYHVRQKEIFRGKRVVIAGGGDSAVDWALNLANIASHVMVVHRRDKFRAAPDSVEKLNQLAALGKIEMVVPYQLDALKGTNGQLQEVIVKDLEDNLKTLQADALLAFFGLSMKLGPIATWNLELTNNHIAVDPSTCHTSTPGIYAIGDIATYTNKQKLILTGFAEAATAASQIRQLVYPGEVFHFEYSTTQGLPQGLPQGAPGKVS